MRVIGKTVLYLFVVVFLWPVIPAGAEQIAKPYTFSPGATIMSSEVNANFDKVYTQVNKLGSAIDVVGGNVGIGTTNPGAKLDIYNNETGHGLYINQSGAFATSKHGLFVRGTNNITSEDSALVKIHHEGGNTTEPCLELVHAGHSSHQLEASGGYFGFKSVSAIGMNHLEATSDNGNLAKTLSVIASGAAVAPTADNLYVGITNPGSLATNAEFDNDGTGHGVFIRQDGVLDPGNHGLKIYSNQAHNNANTALVMIDQNSVSSTEPALEIQNDGSGTGLEVDGAGTGYSAIFNNGNVGIGTTTPSEKLSVAGTIESTSGGIKFPDGTTQTTAASGGGIPTGGIIMWSGSIASIPSGWSLCDGTEGTPDLRDRFILGAGGVGAIGDRGPDGSSSEIDTSLYGSGNDIFMKTNTHPMMDPMATPGPNSATAHHSHNFMPKYYVLAFIIKL